MKRRFYAPAVLCIGLLSAQIVATAHVYLSNLDLLQATDAVMRSGYLAVPNARITAHLDRIGPAMAGGLFFTLSIGAGLSLATLIAVWLWDRAFRRRRRQAAMGILAWGVLLVALNSNGWNPVATLYCLVVPLVTGVAAIQLLPPRTTLVSPGGVVWPVTAVVILALLWSLVLDSQLFVNIRDYMLLTNPLGRSITEAYYAYTLYPAEAFKSLAQKQIRTCRIDDGIGRPLQRRLEATLRTHDYLPIPAGVPVDLTIRSGNAAGSLELDSPQGNVLSVTPQELLQKPDAVLSRYAARLDRNGTFRRLSLICLMFGLPLVLFSVVFSVVGALPHLFLTLAVSDVIAAALCIVLGVILLMPVYRGRNAMAADGQPSAVRVAMLRQACEARRDITDEALRADIAASPNIAERYWLARSLACAADPRAGTLLRRLADDPVPIVACQALWAMGQRKDQSAIPQLIQRLGRSPHWYIQMYAYRALRTLGWVQPRSRQVSY